MKAYHLIPYAGTTVFVKAGTTLKEMFHENNDNTLNVSVKD